MRVLGIVLATAIGIAIGAFGLEGFRAAPPPPLKTENKAVFPPTPVKRKSGMLRRLRPRRPKGEVPPLAPLAIETTSFFKGDRPANPVASRRLTRFAQRVILEDLRAPSAASWHFRQNLSLIHI